MAKTLIGNIMGKTGRGIANIKKTGTTGSVDTYTITYTDSTTSTFTINNSDSISIQRQIVPSAAVESSATASQAYSAGDYVVVGGVLRMVKSAIAKGNTIGDSNSTATTVSGELGSLARTVGEKDTWHSLYETDAWTVKYTKRYDVLYVRFHVSGVTADWWLAGTLPEGYRPEIDYYAPLFNYNSNSCGGVCVDAGGKVYMSSFSSDTSAPSWAIVSVPLW